MVDLSKREGFDAIRTLDDVARFASEVPGAVGFTAHPNKFENGPRYASAVVWYTKLSPTESSSFLYLFDKKEAQSRRIPATPRGRRPWPRRRPRYLAR